MTFADFVCVLGSAAGVVWGKRRLRTRLGRVGSRGGAQRGAAGKLPLGLVSGGLVFFDCRKRNLGCTCSRIPAEDSDGERAHHKENQAGRG